ncbi:MAG: chorismate-binding protein [Candidatus Bathyarchaeia archaeon]
MEALDMAKCPKDGTEVAKPSKEWDVAPKSKKGPKLHVKLYTCPKCGHKWREATKV